MERLTALSLITSRFQPIWEVSHVCDMPQAFRLDDICLHTVIARSTRLFAVDKVDIDIGR